jgi:hypothetical protein
MPFEDRSLVNYKTRCNDVSVELARSTDLNAFSRIDVACDLTLDHHRIVRSRRLPRRGSVFPERRFPRRRGRRSARYRRNSGLPLTRLPFPRYWPFCGSFASFSARLNKPIAVSFAGSRRFFVPYSMLPPNRRFKHGEPVSFTWRSATRGKNTSSGIPQSPKNILRAGGSRWHHEQCLCCTIQRPWLCDEQSGPRHSVLA